MSKHNLLIDSDPDFHKGKGEFVFPNGDKYVGGYCAHRNGVVWREGTGKYTTADGHIYVGEWRDDKLSEHKIVEITYKDGVQFHGHIEKNKYEGPGLYIFDHKMALLCEFSNNKPVGDLILIDVKGAEWHGVAAPDEALLLPEHVYFSNINEHSGKGKRRHFSARQRKRQSEISFRSRSLLAGAKPRAKSFTQRSRSLILSQSSKLTFQMPSKQSFVKEEAKVFAKTKKTASDLQLESSGWYRNYVDFKTVYDNIKDKIVKGGERSLNKDERDWYQKYLSFKQRHNEIMKTWKHKDKKISKEEFFDLISRKEFESKCPPVQVIYPTSDCGSVCDCEFINE